MDSIVSPNNSVEKRDDAKEVDVDHCVICIHDIAPGNRVQLVPCGHNFCSSCLSTWAKSKLTCPLCNGAFQTSKHFSNIEQAEKYEKVTYASPEAQAPVRDFSCLDFDFFLSMGAKILTNVEEAEAALFTSNGVFSARGGTSSTTARSILHNYHARLNEVLTSLLQENHFVPEPLLDEFVTIDQNMQILWTGRIPASFTTPEPNLNDDHYYDEFDEDDEVDQYYGYYRGDRLTVIHSLTSSKGAGRSPAGKFKRKGS